MTIILIVAILSLTPFIVWYLFGRERDTLHIFADNFSITYEDAQELKEKLDNLQPTKCM